MTLTERQVWLVQTTFEKFIVDIDVAARLFYDRLFEIDPTLIPMFRGDARAQGRKLITMILFAVNGLNELDSHRPQIQLMGREHVSYGVKPEHYPIMGDALVWTLKAGLGRDFTPEVEQAWRSVWDYLSEIAIEAAHASDNGGNAG
ncbi:MAG: hemin receptor [Chloroflexi bacterium]|nr:hemin receptor [Chloroflexota bacterium]